MLRNQLYPELEAGTHFEINIRSFPTGTQNTSDHIRQAIQEEQHGKDYHGQLVITAHAILADYYGLYDSIEECFKQANVEAIGTGLHCDLYDEQHKFIVECGYINGFIEAWPAFLEKAVSYAMPPGDMAENATDYTFLHVPKSFYRNQTEFSNPQNVCELADHAFVEITFTNEFLRKADKHHNTRIKKMRDAVNNVSLG